MDTTSTATQTATELTTMAEALNLARYGNPNGSCWGPEVGTN